MTNTPTKVARTGRDFVLSKMATKVFYPSNHVKGMFSPLSTSAKRQSFAALDNDHEVFETVGRAVLASSAEKYCCKILGNDDDYGMTSDIADTLVSLPFLAILCVRAGTGFQKIEDARIIYRMIGWMKKSGGGMPAINKWVARMFEPYIAPGKVGWQQYCSRVAVHVSMKRAALAAAAAAAAATAAPASTSYATITPASTPPSGPLQPRAHSTKHKCPTDAGLHASGRQNVRPASSSSSQPPPSKKRKYAKGGVADKLMRDTYTSLKRKLPY